MMRRRNDIGYRTEKVSESSGTLSQTLATTAGTRYTIKFQLENLGDLLEFFDVAFGDPYFGVLGVLQDAPYFNYTEYTYSAVATGPSTDLTFYFINDYASWGLDNVSVEAVAPAAMPEPTSLALFGFGLAGLGWARRRRKRAI